MTDSTAYLDPYTGTPLYPRSSALSNLSNPHTEVIDAVLDYPSWYYLTEAFSSPSGNLSALADMVTTAQDHYEGGADMVVSFLENHDQPRFPSKTQDVAVRTCLLYLASIILIKW